MTSTTRRLPKTSGAIFQWRSLKTRVTVSTLTFFLVGIWSLAFYAGYTLENDMKQTLGEQQFSTVSIVAMDINNELDDRLKSLEMIAAKITPAMLGNAASMQAFLESQISFRRLFNYGGIVTRLDCVTIADVPVSGRVGIDYSDREYMVEALKGKTTIGKPVLGKKSQSPVFMIVTPVRGAKGKVIGVLGGATDLNKPSFLSKITDNNYGKTGGYMLVSPQLRTTVYATDKRRVMEVLPAPGINPLIDRFVQGYEGSGVAVNPHGAEVLASAKGIPVSGWYVAALMPTKEAFAPVHALQKRVLLATIFLSLLAAVLTWWMLKRQLAPVFATIKTLATLADTDRHPQPLPITMQDEIGELIGGFNHLLGNLEERGKTVRESEARLIKAQEIAHLGSWELDLSTNRLVWSDEIYRIFGLQPQEFGATYEAFLDAVHPDDRVAVDAAYSSSLKEGKDSYEIEHRVVRKHTRDIRYVHERCEHVKDASGRVVRSVGMVHDITERRQMEEALRESEMKLHAIFNTVGAGIVVVDKDTQTITEANQTAMAMTGLPKERIIGQICHSLVCPAQAGKCPVKDLGQRVDHSERKLLCADGRQKDILKTVYPIAIKGRDCYLESFVDISDRKQAETALRIQKETAQRYLDIAPAIIIALDIDGHVTLINAQGSKILECEPDQGIGKNWHDTFLPESAKEQVKRIFAQLMAGDISLAEYVENMVITSRGHERLIGWHNKIIRDEAGKIIGTLSSGEDITDRKQAEEEKAKLEAQLQQAQKMDMVGRLAGGVAHDFNNMLGVILGHAEIAMDQVDPARPLHGDLREIRNAANRSADLTRQLLAFARKQVVSPKVLDLNETVMGMLKMLQRLIGEDINMAWLPGVNLWPVKIDSSQIDQILANLCVNARDAIAGVGKVTIETGNIRFDETYCADHKGFVPGEYVMIAVSDDGCGMDKKTTDNIFEPFFTTKGVGKGTGLGLATVYGIVKQNNGFINVYSEPDNGTTFRIYLPRHIGKAEQARTEGPQEPMMRGRETILLAEDEPSLLELNKLMLETQGYRVLAAGTPGEAIRLAGEYTGEIHLLMTDVVLPEMNGRDLADKMLSLNPNLKCLFTSGYTANVIAHHGVLDDGVCFIQKPFSRRDLAAKVREALDQI